MSPMAFSTVASASRMTGVAWTAATRTVRKMVMRTRLLQQRAQVSPEPGVRDRRGLHPQALAAPLRGQARHGAQHGHTVVAAGLEGAAAQRGAVAADDEAVLCLLDVRAEAAQAGHHP